MRVYISLPITGRDIGEVEARGESASGALERMGHAPVSPLRVSSDPAASYAEHMGNDIRALLGCDAACFLDGWESSRGCRLERAAAEIYGKRILDGLPRAAGPAGKDAPDGVENQQLTTDEP